MSTLLVLTIALTTLVALFQVWWSLSYLYAYSQTRETIMLTQIVQGVAIGVLFVSITINLLTGQKVVGVTSGLLLLLSVGMTVLWRRQGGIDRLFEYYPGAIVDVLLFRKPKVDLKRKVRGR
jgi:hypothetical protein